MSTIIPIPATLTAEAVAKRGKTMSTIIPIPATFPTYQDLITAAIKSLSC